jgi:nitroreductase
MNTTRTHASRNTIIAGAGGIALTALGYRAWDRGVFTGATGPAYTSWDDWRGSGLDGNRRPLRAAVLAASPHNTQPWQFEVSTAAITVYADRARHLGSFDPFRREMHLGLGCAIENFVLAARAFGIATDVHVANGRFGLSPGPQPVVAARIALGPGRPSHDPLFDAIPKRRTHRGPYRDQSIAPERLRELADLVSSPTLRVVFLADDVARREVGGLIVEATERIIADPDMSLDSFRWIRTGRRDILAQRDGVTIDTAGASRLKTVAAKILPDLDAPAIDRIWVDATRATQTATAPVFGMILVPDRLDMAQAITAGRAWQRLHLAATAHGLAAQPLNQPVEMIDRNQMLGRQDEFGSGLATLARDNRWEPTFVFRLGYAEREAPHSPRRLLDDVVITAPLATDAL